MKILLTTALLLLTSCASKHSIDVFHPHLFSQDIKFVEENLKCESKFLTDTYDTTNNEVFRCSADNSNIFFTIESNGNNSEDLKQAKVIWKQWRTDIGAKESKVKAQQFIAVLAKLYAKDKEFELVDAFFNKQPAEFESHMYTVKTSADTKQFYTLRRAVVTFK
tara:strand:- start:1883 stop:2374 length:492 start_codon:yes stop_codon:yes gene_type:complete